MACYGACLFYSLTSLSAYYEREWFTGNDVGSAFDELASDNYTIILERTTARDLDLRIGDGITLTIGPNTTRLRVVGCFGSEATGSAPVFGPLEFMSYSRLWSYVPADLYRSLPTIYASGKLLVNLERDANATAVAGGIRDLESQDISYVSSVEEQLELRESNLLLTGVTNIQQIGVIFSVVAASVATALVTIVSLQERRKEVTIMNVRGISYNQLLKVLMAETLSIVVFAVALGIAVGLIVVHGSVVALNTTQYTILVAHRMIFPLDAILTLSTSIVLIFLASIIPVIVITRRYLTKIVRIVRA